MLAVNVIVERVCMSAPYILQCVAAVPDQLLCTVHAIAGVVVLLLADAAVPLCCMPATSCCSNTAHTAVWCHALCALSSGLAWWVLLNPLFGRIR